MKKLIIANWKMNPETIEEARTLFSGAKRTAKQLHRVRAVICPPFVFLDDVSRKITSVKCTLGAQDAFWEHNGAYTGEISPRQLAELGVRYVILGHSERRLLGETNEEVNKKVRACLAENLIVVLCIGESERDKQGEYLDFLRNELIQSLARVKKKELEKLIVAYEPIWAISSHNKGADTPENVLDTTLFIRKVLTNVYDKKRGAMVPIIYGGSVNEDNAESFLQEARVDGFLVGSASLDAQHFSALLKISERAKT